MDGAQGRAAERQAVGRDVTERVRAEERIEQVLKGRGVAYTVLRKDGTTFPMAVDASALLDVEGKVRGFIGVGRDVTERKRMEAVGRLAAGVAHDCSNYLTVMDSFVGLLLDDLSADDPRRPVSTLR